LPVQQIENIRLTQDAANLADQYILAKVVGQISRAACQHIAMATVAKADVLVSWNFKHIVNLDKIRGYNGINCQLGYQMLEIRTPKEITIMTTQTYDTEHDVVNELCKIRDQISSEIKNMTFEEERAYLDKLLADKAKYAHSKMDAANGSAGC
jgi:hypothetical protein